MKHSRSQCWEYLKSNCTTLSCSNFGKVCCEAPSDWGATMKPEAETKVTKIMWKLNIYDNWKESFRNTSRSLQGVHWRAQGPSKAALSHSWRSIAASWRGRARTKIRGRVTKEMRQQRKDVRQKYLETQRELRCCFFRVSQRRFGRKVKHIQEHNAQVKTTEALQPPKTLLHLGQRGYNTKLGATAISITSKYSKSMDECNQRSIAYLIKYAKKKNSWRTTCHSLSVVCRQVLQDHLHLFFSNTSSLKETVTSTEHPASTRNESTSEEVQGNLSHGPVATQNSKTNDKNENIELAQGKPLPELPEWWQEFTRDSSCEPVRKETPGMKVFILTVLNDQDCEIQEAQNYLDPVHETHKWSHTSRIKNLGPISAEHRVLIEITSSLTADSWKTHTRTHTHKNSPNMDLEHPSVPWAQLTSTHLDFLRRWHRHSTSQHHNIRPNSKNTGSATMQMWKITPNGCKVRCAQGWELFSLWSDLGPRRPCVKRSMSLCNNITRIQQASWQQTCHAEKLKGKMSQIQNFTWRHCRGSCNRGFIPWKLAWICEVAHGIIEESTPTVQICRGLLNSSTLNGGRNFCATVAIDHLTADGFHGILLLSERKIRICRLKGEVPKRKVHRRINWVSELYLDRWLIITPILFLIITQILFLTFWDSTNSGKQRCPEHSSNMSGTQEGRKIGAESSFASVEDDTKTGAKCAVHKDENCLLFDSTWAQDVCVWREVSHCATTLHVFNKHASSRREAVSDSRGIPRCTEKNFKESSHAHMCRSFDLSSPSYAYPEISKVISSRSTQYPCQALISICGISRVTVLSFQTKCWMNRNLVWMCFILRLAPRFVVTARAVLLSALECISNDSPISFSMACAKINSADSAPRTYISYSPLTRQQSPVLDIHSSKLINVTQCARCALPRHSSSPAQSASEYPVVRFKVLFQSSGFNASISSGRDSVLLFLSNISTLSWHVSNLQVLVTQVCMTSILSRTSSLVSLQ